MECTFIVIDISSQACSRSLLVLALIWYQVPWGDAGGRVSI